MILKIHTPEETATRHQLYCFANSKPRESGAFTFPSDIPTRLWSTLNSNFLYPADQFPSMRARMFCTVANKTAGSERTSSGRENAAVSASGGSSGSGRGAWSLHGGGIVGGAAGSGGSGAAASGGREGYAEWKSKALASMEKRVVNGLGGESPSSLTGGEQANGTEQGADVFSSCVSRVFLPDRGHSVGLRSMRMMTTNCTN